jgi:hypothetical protein
MSNLRLMSAVASALLVVPVTARGADAPATALPDEEFIEYLGSWDGDDSDWIVLQGGPSKPASPEPAERAPKVAEGPDQTGGKVPQERMK